ncbi:hypothetical protein GBF38_017540 [Nibea albiflora]|uniref:Uncharacterized protein n=1 Tax=Nibea albiflora TaxID=240163 RepID=A0ACB7FK56_NIBAL|nr:hypothetical protein GBF38_017540 [Nibea albiflora]
MESKQYVAAFVRPAANSTKLEETKAQLQRQKFLKEINKEKETRRELERLKKYTNPEPLSTTKTANRVRDNTTRRRTKLLQVDYEELQVAERAADALQRDLDNKIVQKNHMQFFDEATAALQVEREKNKTLQNQLDKARLGSVLSTEWAGWESLPALAVSGVTLAAVAASSHPPTSRFQ